MPFSAEETRACKELVRLALEEDLGTRGDVTSQAVIPADLAGKSVFVARSPGIIAGLPAAALVAEAIDTRLALAPLLADGTHVKPGDRLATLSGPMRGILAVERSALNFLQHLSGIATLTRQYVDTVAGLQVKILDTRKTIPGYRLLAKYAVRAGGGYNHRLGLHDGILVKDNHLRGLQIVDWRMQIEGAVRAARAGQPNAPLELEVESLEQLEIALVCRPDIVLLDNMPPTMLRRAVERRDGTAPEVLLEASGGVTLDTVRTIAETGVERISIGALTHSAPALDVALDYQM